MIAEPPARQVIAELVRASLQSTDRVTAAVKASTTDLASLD
jgi:hypothetical protein